MVAQQIFTYVVVSHKVDAHAIDLFFISVLLLQTKYITTTNITTISKHATAVEAFTSNTVRGTIFSQRSPSYAQLYAT